MKIQRLIKNDKINTIKDYYNIIVNINNQYINNDISYTVYINTYNFVYKLIENDNTLSNQDKLKIYDFIKAVKHLSI